LTGAGFRHAAKARYVEFMSEPKELQTRPLRDYHLNEWTSGSRGGGSVPADFEWRSNPKQSQEESGTSLSARVKKPA
jgi:hypothetical protein